MSSAISELLATDTEAIRATGGRLRGHVADYDDARSGLHRSAAGTEAAWQGLAASSWGGAVRALGAAYGQTAVVLGQLAGVLLAFAGAVEAARDMLHRAQLRREAVNAAHGWTGPVVTLPGDPAGPAGPLAAGRADPGYRDCLMWTLRGEAEAAYEQAVRAVHDGLSMLRTDMLIVPPPGGPIALPPGQIVAGPPPPKPPPHPRPPAGPSPAQQVGSTAPQDDPRTPIDPSVSAVRPVSPPHLSGGGSSGQPPVMAATLGSGVAGRARIDGRPPTALRGPTFGISKPIPTTPAGRTTSTWRPGPHGNELPQKVHPARSPLPRTCHPPHDLIRPDGSPTVKQPPRDGPVIADALTPHRPGSPHRPPVPHGPARLIPTTPRTPDATS